MSTNKRVTLSVAQKQELCQKKIDNPSIPNIELARQYNVKPNTVSDILKRKSEYLSVSSSELERKRFRQPMYKEIDDAVGIWMSQFLAANQTLRVENRVEEDDISQELNTPIAPVNIRNAIDFVVEAWNQVDLLTIKNCWLKTGIIPPDDERDVDIELNFNRENDENNLNDAIQKLPYDDILSGLEYINVDKLGEDEILLEDDEIVETVRSRHNAETVQDDDKNEFIPNISLSDVLSSVEKLITFHNFPPENYEVTSDELKILKGIRRKVLRFKSESMLQLNLDEYVICE
ncbi:unnamed protein product [Rhizophagus irregularis]|nr:unnamed protein product [Rhizophagus irregularis]